MTLDDFYRTLALPESARLGARIYKKQLLEQDGLTAADRKLVTEEVESLEWRYALKPASMAIVAYADDEREYHEIALIHVQMRQPKQAARVAEIVQRCIQYPVILVLACADEAGESVYLSLADKRINRADASRLTVEQRQDSGWLLLAGLSPVQQAFVDSLCATGFSHVHFYAFYQDMMRRLTALQAAELTGVFRVPGDAAGSLAQQAATAECLRLRREMDGVRARAAKEKQMNRRVELNIQLRQLQTRVDALLPQL